MFVRFHAVVAGVLRDVDDVFINIYRQRRAGDVVVIDPVAADALSPRPFAKMLVHLGEAVSERFEFWIFVHVTAKVHFFVNNLSRICIREMIVGLE